MKAFIGGAALALLLAGCGDDKAGNSAGNGAGPPLAQIPAPNGDWTEMVEATPEGGFRMGNPNAPVKLVEYGSLGCHVCAAFSKEGGEPLRANYVKTGQVSWEFRPYILFPSDPGVSMLLRCHGPGAFFQLSDQLYADQPNWIAKLQALPPEVQQQLQAMTPQQQSVTYVRAAGIDQFFRVRGMPEARIDACLADSQGMQKLAEVSARGNREGVNGTPTFFINGVRAERAASWAALEPLLRAAAR
jgi:protein-disulfide isomerase